MRALLSLVALVVILCAPALAAADPLSDWTAGPNAIGDNTYAGFIDTPAMNATVSTSNFTVSGWFVDTQAEGWAGADDVQIWQGTMDGGGMLLAHAAFAQNRPDVGIALGNPFWANSGFVGTVPPGALGTGAQTLSVYVHTPGKGWWFKQVQVNVSPSAGVGVPTSTAGAQPPVIVVESPNQGTSFTTKQTFQVIGYALDPAAAANQGSQGSGIDSVTVYADAPREQNGNFMGHADLGFSDATAAAAYGSQFAYSGWRFNVSATSFHAGVHNLYFYAHSVVTGKENRVALGFAVTESQ
jgi:hypothetical protein